MNQIHFEKSTGKKLAFIITLCQLQLLKLKILIVNINNAREFINHCVSCKL